MYHHMLRLAVELIKEWLVNCYNLIIGAKVSGSSFVSRDLCEQIRKKIKSNILKDKTRVRVCFICVYDGIFPTLPIYEKMLEDIMFSPQLLVVPDVFRGKENAERQLILTFDSLSKRYDNVRIPRIDGEFVDIKNDYDLAFFYYPPEYDCLMHPFYKVSYLCKSMLGVFVPYGPSVSQQTSRQVFCSRSDYNRFWMCFLENLFHYTLLLGVKNKHIVGMPKMDFLRKISLKTKKNKKILICFHHSIYDNSEVSFSTFLWYYNSFFDVFHKYQNIDFIFRPHPLLEVELRKENVWGKEKTEKYFSEISSLQNVEYQNGGDYLDSFVNSDAMIHDCGSFMQEYLYTGHPVCYLMKDKNTNDRNFNSFARECLKYHYQAFSKEDILNFIEKVVLDGHDCLKDKRQKFFNRNIKYGYPYVSDVIVKTIKREIMK